MCVLFFFSSRRRHTRCALVTGVQTCALPIYPLTGNRDRGVEAVFYSPPLAYDWRVFAGAGHASGRFEEGKGEHDSAFAGIEYRARDLVVEAEASGHRYGYGSKLGARLSATADINDHRSEEHTSELQSLMRISYAVFCLKTKKTTT